MSDSSSSQPGICNQDTQTSPPPETDSQTQTKTPTTEKSSGVATKFSGKIDFRVAIDSSMPTGEPRVIGDVVQKHSLPNHTKCPVGATKTSDSATRASAVKYVRTQPLSHSSSCQHAHHKASNLTSINYSTSPDQAGKGFPPISENRARLRKRTRALLPNGKRGPVTARVLCADVQNVMEVRLRGRHHRLLMKAAPRSVHDPMEHIPQELDLR
eukprot:50767_1